jgi:hypothetical protein
MPSAKALKEAAAWSVIDKTVLGGVTDAAKSDGKAAANFERRLRNTSETRLQFSPYLQLKVHRFIEEWKSKGRPMNFWTVAGLWGAHHPIHPDVLAIFASQTSDRPQSDTKKTATSRIPSIMGRGSKGAGSAGRIRTLIGNASGGSSSSAGSAGTSMVEVEEEAMEQAPVKSAGWSLVQKVAVGVGAAVVLGGVGYAVAGGKK